MDGVRTPFATGLTDLQHLDGHALLTASLRALLERTGVAAGRVEHVIAGTTNQDPRQVPLVWRAVVALVTFYEQSNSDFRDRSGGRATIWT